MLDDVQVVAFDIFGTVVDWRTGITEQVGAVFADRGVALDPAGFADSWRDRYLPAMARVDRGEREWATLDALHRESLDELLAERGIAEAVGEADRARLVRAWHRLPAWPDSADLLARLRTRYVVVALSNGGFRLLTDLLKAAELTVDAITSAELARSYKPSPAAYLTTARLLDVEPHRLLLVAAHRWDVDGARAAGLRTAFLERPGEKGPHREADRAADVTCDIAATSAAELATRLGC
ncbi:haloacid dehalogenase type II [Saccharopolyspora sp. NPDC047091]|uniref:haloacid dehalogenase type II n=1 Tax=Saccharopolyspora sp. NPDC047091 TaxID=3155924 RepID=UPI0033E982E7